MNRKIIAWIIVLLICVNVALALGVRPAKTVVESEKYDTYSGSFWVVNNDKQELRLRVYAEGDLEGDVRIDEDKIEFNPYTELSRVKFNFTVPKDLPPGESISYIVVEQDVETEEENVISVKLRIKHKIILQGPFPDKFIAADLRFLERDKDVSMVAEVINKGKEDIGHVQTTFYVNDKEQQEQILETGAVDLKVDERKLLKTAIDKELLERGEFEVKAVTLYDDQEIELVKKMIVGTPEVEVVYFDEFFRANSINKYNMDLFNHWNKEVENVYVDVSLKKDDEVLDTFRTKSDNIDAQVSKRFSDFFDASGDAPGLYSFDMIVHFWNTHRMDSQKFESKFLTSEEYDQFMSQEAGPFNIWYVLVPLFVLIFVGAFVFNVYLVKKVLAKNVTKDDQEVPEDDVKEAVPEEKPKNKEKDLDHGDSIFD